MGTGWLQFSVNPSLQQAMGTAGFRNQSLRAKHGMARQIESCGEVDLGHRQSPPIPFTSCQFVELSIDPGYVAFRGFLDDSSSIFFYHDVEVPVQEIKGESTHRLRNPCHCSA